MIDFRSREFVSRGKKRLQDPTDDELRERWNDEENWGETNFTYGEAVDTSRISESRIICDIEESPSGFWWLFRYHDYKSDWHVAKYEEEGKASCRIYVGPDGETAYDWNPASWHLKF